MRCKCNGLMERILKPEHVEDLGGLVVKVLNAVVVQRCSACGEEMVGIPDLQGLTRAAAIRLSRRKAYLLSKWLGYVCSTALKKTKTCGARPLNCGLRSITVNLRTTIRGVSVAAARGHRRADVRPSWRSP